jgi:hypothetical protein
MPARALQVNMLGRFHPKKCNLELLFCPHEWPQLRAALQHFEAMANCGKGPLANGEGWYDTIGACNSAEATDLAFAIKLEIWARYALS